MADGNVELVVRVAAVGGTATCGVCGALVAWKLSFEELQSLGGRRCPRCGGSLEVHEESLVHEITIEPMGGAR
jgi:transcription elongation factor Elf1